MMLAIVVREPGGPEALRFTETGRPIPAADEVLIRVRAAGVNRPDVLQRKGQYPPPPGASPLIGLEVAGESVELGSAAVGFEVGERVAALTNGGGFAQDCAVPAAQCLPWPAGYDAIRAAALFIDVDGTLLDIAAHPQDVRVDPALLRALCRIQLRVGGALALLSGRSLEDLSRLFAPLELPMAGLHGLQRRAADGRTTFAAVPAEAMEYARQALRGFVAANPGLLLEDKGGSLAVHFRQLPSSEAVVARTCAELVAELGDEFHVQPGLLVQEIKSRLANKGTALRDFMTEPPFAARRPVAIGDDLTDVDAFHAAERLGGAGVAVGDRVSARWRLDGPPALRAWLALLAETASNLRSPMPACAGRERACGPRGADGAGWSG